MSGSGQAATSRSRPSSLHRSAATATTRAPVSPRIAAAVVSTRSASRPLTTTDTLSRARASAQARPSPLLEAHTIARRPSSPRFIASAPSCDPSGPREDRGQHVRERAGGGHAVRRAPRDVLVGAYQHRASGVDAEERRPVPAFIDDIPSDDQAIDRYPTGGGRLPRVPPRASHQREAAVGEEIEA